MSESLDDYIREIVEVLNDRNACDRRLNEILSRIDDKDLKCNVRYCMYLLSLENEPTIEKFKLLVETYGERHVKRV